MWLKLKQLKLKQLLWQWRGVWITAPSVGVAVLMLQTIGLLQPWELAAFDQYMQLRPLEPPDHRIAIVGINEADLRYVGQSPIPDGVYATLLKKLKAMQPRAIGLDIYRDLKVEPGHQELVQVYASTPNLVGIQKVVGDQSRESVSAPLGMKKEQVGANDLIFDVDRKTRRGFIYVPDETGEIVFSFGMHLALHYLEAKGIAPQQIAGTETKWKLGKAVFVPFEANDGGYVREKAGGYQVLVNYRGPSRYFTTVSMTDILQNKVPPNWGRDRIILIGAVGESIQDLYFTPFSSNLFTVSERMAGVEIHANLVSQVISAAIDHRPLFRTWLEPYEWLWILFWSGVGATLTWKWRYAIGVSRLSFRGTIGAILATIALLGITYGAFLTGWWIPVIPPLLALFGAAIAITGYIARTAGEIRKTFGRYLTEQVVANLLESRDGLKLGGERRKITLLTSDIRGFTAASERLPAEEVINIINTYLSSMADVITNYQGTIDEFMGDGILVLFGAPTARVNDPERAVACAVAMQLAMTAVNEKLQHLDLPQLEMGIGVNTGEVVVGNIGSEKRTKYGVVGSEVNLTYRIESYTVGGQILITESTLKDVDSIVKLGAQKEIILKGIKQPITIYEVLGICGQHNLFLPEEEEIFFSLTDQIPIQYALLDGKRICSSFFKGDIVKLSAKEAEIRSLSIEEDFLPTPMSNLKLNLLLPNNYASEDIYAKVMEKPAENGSFYIHFTSKPSDVEAILNAAYKSIRVKT